MEKKDKRRVKRTKHGWIWHTWLNLPIKAKLSCFSDDWIHPTLRVWYADDMSPVPITNYWGKDIFKTREECVINYLKRQMK